VAPRELLDGLAALRQGSRLQASRSMVRRRGDTLPGGRRDTVLRSWATRTCAFFATGVVGRQEMRRPGWMRYSAARSVQVRRTCAAPGSVTWMWTTDQGSHRSRIRNSMVPRSPRSLSSNARLSPSAMQGASPGRLSKAKRTTTRRHFGFLDGLAKRACRPGRQTDADRRLVVLYIRPASGPPHGLMFSLSSGSPACTATTIVGWTGADSGHLGPSVRCSPSLYVW
jgi:hypothetical protein